VGEETDAAPINKTNNFQVTLVNDKCTEGNKME
jgi:hypothetical protein